MLKFAMVFGIVSIALCINEDATHYYALTLAKILKCDMVGILSFPLKQKRG